MTQRTWIRAAAIVALTAGVTAHVHAQAPFEHSFTVQTAGEAVATITAGCERCDWGEAGREGALLRVLIDGRYSQHLLLARGATQSAYRIMLGPLSAGQHRLTLERDEIRSAKGSGPSTVGAVGIEVYPKDRPEHEWLSRAPFIHARPGTLERFSDLPILTWVERAPAPGIGFRYSVIFTHEDGGTPTDRLMATWGRTTDVEFVYSHERTPDGVLYEEIQGRNHDILPFKGEKVGEHPLLWVFTDNNMVSDTGPAEAVRFGLAPELVMLDNVSREAVMDRNSWTYAVMAAELRREGRLDPAAQPGSARIPDPRRFAYLEGCAEIDRAVFALEVGIRGANGSVQWHATDRGEPRFRVARGGCFRAAVPLPSGTSAGDIEAVRLRAYTRPRRDTEPVMPAGTGRVVLRRFNGVFMLDEQYRPGAAVLVTATPVEARGEADGALVGTPRPAGAKR